MSWPCKDLSRGWWIIKFRCRVMALVVLGQPLRDGGRGTYTSPGEDGVRSEQSKQRGGERA